jgi:hypothetical protein
MKFFKLILKIFFFISSLFVFYCYGEKEIIEINLFKVDILKEIPGFYSYKDLMKNGEFLYSNLKSLIENGFIDYTEITGYVKNGEKWVYDIMKNISDKPLKEGIYFEIIPEIEKGEKVIVKGIFKVKKLENEKEKEILSGESEKLISFFKLIDFEKPQIIGGIESNNYKVILMIKTAKYYELNSELEIYFGENKIIDNSDIICVKFSGKSMKNSKEMEIVFNEEGIKKFKEVTKNIGERLSIVINSKIVSTPVIREEIPDCKKLKISISK